jgi:hypothetical protein
LNAHHRSILSALALGRIGHSRLCLAAGLPIFRGQTTTTTSGSPALAGYGTDPQGRPLDQTYKATISRFDQLPDTAANREQLGMRPHPNARRVTHDPTQAP